MIASHRVSLQKPPNSAEVEAEASGAVAASPPSAMPCCPTRVVRTINDACYALGLVYYFFHTVRLSSLGVGQNV